jgi:hypothetical protein
LLEKNMTRGVRAERQAKLRLLESVRLKTDEERKQIEQKHAAIRALMPAQAEEVLARILEMSTDALVDVFQDYSLRMAGENPFYYTYGDPRDTPHKDDLELAAAVEAVNLALHEYDQARLALRVAEFFGGRVSPRKSEADPKGPAWWSDSAVIKLDMLEILISATKASSFYESLRGGDLRTLERENFKEVWPLCTSARVSKKACDGHPAPTGHPRSLRR